MDISMVLFSEGTPKQLKGNASTENRTTGIEHEEYSTNRTLFYLVCCTIRKQDSIFWKQDLSWNVKYF
jgi:hypothetical protein